MFDSSYNLALWLFQIINGENYRETSIGEKFSKNQQAGTNQEPEVSTTILLSGFFIGVLLIMHLSCSYNQKNYISHIGQTVIGIFWSN